MEPSDRGGDSSQVTILFPRGLAPLGCDAVAQRLADDVYPTAAVELGQDVGNVGLHGSPGQEHAAGDVRRRVAPGDQGADLDLGGGERRPAESRAGRAAPPNAPPNAVRAQPTL